MSLICPHCGGVAVNNGSVRAVCRICYKSFRKDKAIWQTPKNDEVYGTEHYPKKVSIERLI